MMSDKLRLLAQAHLEKIGVELILSDRVVSNTETHVRLIQMVSMSLSSF